MMKRIEIAGRLTGLIGLGMIFGSIGRSPIDTFLLGTVTVIVSFIMVIVGRELK